ncbi:MAG: hypothetical protein U0Z53_03135 [Blastocatellia bacterium]
MTVQEIIAAIPALSFEERVTVLRVLTQSLRSQGKRKKYRGVPADELRGVLKTVSPAPADDEIREAYTDYLMEKYK